jgi:hypothetical protein
MICYLSCWSGDVARLEVEGQIWRGRFLLIRTLRTLGLPLCSLFSLSFAVSIQGEEKRTERKLDLAAEGTKHPIGSRNQSRERASVVEPPR